MASEDTTEIEDPSWSVCIDLENPSGSKSIAPVAPVPVKAEPPTHTVKRSKVDFFFSRLVPKGDERLGPLAYTFLRNAHIARSVGWLLYATLLTALLFGTSLHPMWWVSCICIAVVYPHIASWVILRSRNHLRANFLCQILEAGIYLSFCSLLSMDPWLVTTVVAISFMNVVLSNGMRLGILIMGLSVGYGALLTAASPLPQAPMTASGPWFIGSALIFYLGLIGYRTHNMSILYSRDRRQLKQETQTVERLHQHFIDTVVQPYMSADDFVALIRPRVTPKEAEAFKTRIQKRQQMESLGRRAGGIAHDAKNLLQPILIISEMMKADAGDDTETLELLDDMIAASMRANDLLSQLQQTKVTTTTPENTACDVRATVGEAVRLLQQSTPAHVGVEYHHSVLADETTHVAMHATTLHQVVMNLGLNGIQSMDGTGILEIVLSEFDTSKEDISLPPHLSERGCVALTVRDTGCGISKEVIDKIFEPYFTTKKHSGGTGLGLATTQAIIHDAGGMIRVLSKAQVGTQFRILLPRCATPTNDG